MCSRVDSTHFNQVKGKVIETYFNNGEIFKTDVNGNGQTYYLSLIHISATWLASRSRESYIVSRNPSISSPGFSFVLVILIVFSSLPSPSSAKYSHCTGISTLSEATSAFSVTSPSDGEQSIRIKSVSYTHLSSIADFCFSLRVS